MPRTPSTGARARRAAPRRVAFTVLVGLVVLVGAIAASTATGGSAASRAKTLKLASVQPVLTSTETSTTKSLLGQIARSDPALLSRTDSTPVNAVVKLDYDSVASYPGNVAGYKATNPRKTGKKLKDNKAAVDAYSSYVASREAHAIAAIKAKVPSAQIREGFRTVYGGVAVTLPANQAKELLTVPSVVAVQSDSIRQPLTDATPAFLGADQVWPSLGGDTKAGQGVVVGVIDTGIWPEHPSFAENGIDNPGGGPYACEFGTSGQADDAPFSCNDKLIGAYAFTDTYMSLNDAAPGEFCDNATNMCSARDADGHGTHTASTAAGSRVEHATLLGNDYGTVSGMAPGASIIAYRVCLELGCYSSDSVAAINQAIADGVDVINFSISGGANAYTDPVELAFLDAYAAGVDVNASAGNAGPGAGTANHAGPWVTTVGASTSNRSFLSKLTLKSGNGDTVAVDGVTVTQGVPDTPVVINTADPFCANAAAPGSFTGKVVVCQRGAGIGRVAKGYNVLQGDAAGMILYNPTKQDLESDSHWLPAIHIEGPATGSGNAAQVLDFINAHPDATASWTTGTKTTTQGDVMAAFSSRGPLGDFIKPDVTAPGVQILAGMTPDPFDGNIAVGPPGQLFQAIAGTSMSSPHSAGVAALVRAAHPDWTPGQVKSALMTSSVQAVTKEDGVTAADPFDRGSGSIRANRAVDPTATFDVDPIEYIASAGSVLGRIDLNLPSVNAPIMSGQITTWRTMHNVTGSHQRLAVSTIAPPGAEIIVAKSRKGSRPERRSDRTISLPSRDDVTFQITIKAPSLVDGQQYFGQITLTPESGRTPIVIPVAFKKQQGVVALKHLCTPTTFPRKASTTCNVYAENFAAQDADVKLEVRGDRGLRFSNVTEPGRRHGSDRITWSGTLKAVEPPNVSVVPDPGGSPAGYLPLSLFGIQPIAGTADETISNFSVPGFLFGGETWNAIGLVSNGYAVVGGGSQSDVDFVNQELPNPAAPNNVLAPFWSDLNPAFGGALRIGTLTDGTDTWLVLDWEAVREYSAPKANSFQIWIRAANAANPVEDVTFTYGPIQGNGDAGAMTTGAENKLGNRGQSVYYNGTGTIPTADTELRVSSSPSAPGGTVSFNYDASAKRVGTYTTTANLTSSITPGITQVQQMLTTTG